ncbi:MAG: hypothetical protein QM662_05305 [Gordonia sp. (in: high G+C Gram-positive bacteria)]
MPVIAADADGIDDFASWVAQLAEGALAVIECLDISGNHGTRQGMAVNAAIAEFQTVLGPDVKRALHEVSEHARATSAIAGIVRETETQMVATTSAIQAKAETELGLTGLGRL